MSSAIYFLDAQVAQATAFDLIDQALAEDKTLEQVSLCYYHAEQSLIDSAPNCIWLPLENVYDFFRYSHLPLPETINFSGKLQFLETDADFLNEFKDMLHQVKQYRAQLLRLYTHSPLNRDALFLDSQIALLTAVRDFSRVKDGVSVKQMCYYLGEKLNTNIENLIHIDLDHYVSFFASSVHSAPNIIVPSTHMTLEQSIVFEKELAELNKTVSLYKCAG